MGFGEAQGTGGTAGAITSGVGFVNGGNSFGANAILGLNDAFRLDVVASGTTLMSFLPTGEVLIGVTTPPFSGNLLGIQEDTNGHVRASFSKNGTNGTAARVSHSLEVVGGSSFWQQTSASFTGSGLVQGDSIIFGGSSADVQIGTTTANSVSTWVDDTERVRCGTSDSQVGHLGLNEESTNFKIATTAIIGVTGATVSAAALIPAGALVIGISTRITVAFGATNGTTGYAVGDGTDPNRWGDIATITAGTTSGSTDYTGTAIQFFTAANDVVLTAAGGDFDGTGNIRIKVHYIDVTAPTS